MNELVALWCMGAFLHIIDGEYSGSNSHVLLSQSACYGGYKLLNGRKSATKILAMGGLEPARSAFQVGFHALPTSLSHVTFTTSCGLSELIVSRKIVPY